MDIKERRRKIKEGTELTALGTILTNVPLFVRITERYIHIRNYDLSMPYANSRELTIEDKWAIVLRDILNELYPYEDNMPEIEYQEWQTEVLIELARVTKKGGSLFYQHKNRGKGCPFCGEEKKKQSYLDVDDIYPSDGEG